jgi:signal transduction histidine kinase
LVDRQVKRLTQLVSNLLDVSRVQAGRIQLARERVNLGELARDVAERFTHVFSTAGCAMKICSSDEVVGLWDRSRLDQVITNLLSNAVKFGKGFPVELTVGSEESRARLVVRDHGIGIPPEQLPRVFERFERAVPTRSYGGLGLGLFIVRGIVETHGGTVRAENLPERGTAITVELPLRPPPELAS